MDTGHQRLPNLLSPITVNNVTLKNRIVSSDHTTRLVESHFIGDRVHRR